VYEDQQGQCFAYEDNTVMVMTDRGTWESSVKALFNKISNHRYQLILENENGSNVPLRGVLVWDAPSVPVLVTGGL
jgi:hypothetical protein